MTLPVPSQRTWSPFDFTTAAMMNANVRDPVNFLANVPLCTAYQATSQAIGANAWTAITLDSTVTDTYSGHSNTVNNSRYTAQVSGWYFAFGMVSLAAGTGIRYAAIYSNGASTIQQPASSQNAASSAPNEQYAMGLHFLSAGSYIELKTYTSAALSTVVSPQGQQSMLGVWWVHS